MARVGQYTSLPLPSAWCPVLENLRENECLPPARGLPSLGALVDACLITMEERHQRLLWSRFAEEQTLQAVGDLLDLTRERVRQLSVKLSKKFWKAGRLTQVIEEVRTGLLRSGVLLLDLNGASSQCFPQATPDQLWRFVTALWEVRAPVFQARIRAGVWVLAANELPNPRRVRALVQDRAAFLSPEELAGALNVPIHHIQSLLLGIDDVWFTRSDAFGWAKWTLPQWIQAIADKLAAANFYSWHFSEMAAALAFVNPGEFKDLPGRNVAAVLSRPDQSCFEYAGRKGYWRLSRLGDGHVDNASAIYAVLEASELPLPSWVICQRLQRDVAEGTVYALLERDGRFERFPGSVFGLQGRSHVQHFPEDDWMQEQFDQLGQEEVPAEDIHQRAVACGLSPDRLMCIGRVSRSFRWWRRGKYPPIYVSARREAQLLFRRWYARREQVADAPAPQVLVAGLEAAFQEGDREMLLHTAQTLYDLKVEWPEQARQWLTWAVQQS